MCSTSTSHYCKPNGALPGKLSRAMRVVSMTSVLASLQPGDFSSQLDLEQPIESCCFLKVIGLLKPIENNHLESHVFCWVSQNIYRKLLVYVLTISLLCKLQGTDRQTFPRLRRSQAIALKMSGGQPRHAFLEFLATHLRAMRGWHETPSEHLGQYEDDQDTVTIRVYVVDNM